MATRAPGIFGSGNTGPMVLIYSPREKIRDIIAVGLIQCNYQIIQAHTSYLASIKISQMLPKIVIADISTENTKDILMLERLQKSQRLANVNILLILPVNLPPEIAEVVSELSARTFEDNLKRFLTIGYPFAFADLLSVLKRFGQSDESSALKNAAAFKKNELISAEKTKLIESRLFDLSIPASVKLTEIGKALQQNWAFPFTVVKALDIIESDASCSTELSKCISTDPAAASTILKIANTTQYAQRHGRVTEVKEAVVRIGFKETRNIMAYLSLIDLSPEVYKNRGFGRREFWLHSLAVGVIAEKICTDFQLHRPELAFMAGLLHDLGKIPLDNNFDMAFLKLLDDSMASVNAFHVSEQRLIGFTHAHLGHYLTTQWNFPSPICQAILNHHNPERILQTPVQYDRIIQEAVFIANLLAKAAQIGHTCDEILPEIPVEMMRELHLVNGITEKFVNSIIKQLRIMCNFLNLPGQSLNFGEMRQENADTQILIVYNERQIFHPVVITLKINGFNVKVANNLTPENSNNVKVIIAMPDKGIPLDVMFYGDDRDIHKENDVLKIFLVDLEQYQNTSQSITNANLVFMDRNNFDMRVLLHTLDSFFGKVVTPSEPQQNIS